MNYKHLTAIAAASLLASIANAEWHYGVGTGLGSANYDGTLKNKDLGLKLDIDFDHSDVESGIGGAAFATDGTWIFNLSGSSVEYESKGTVKPTGIRSKNTFERTYGEFTVGYVAYREDAITLTPYLGINYTKHHWKLKGGGYNEKLDDNWTDAVLGLKFDYKINEEWSWNSSADYTNGDSEGCYSFKTGPSWKFAENWVAGAYLAYEHDKFDGKDSGVDFDYDADVTSFGLSIAYTW
jgi:hypothetical protein